ncbi:hypothetical protein SLE2022_017570 [Rubroshorea leprosula]
MENNNCTSNSNGKSRFGDGAKTMNKQEENLNVYCDDNDLNVESEEEEEEEHERQEAPRQSPSRTLFTNLSKVNANLDLAETLQEQLKIKTAMFKKWSIGLKVDGAGNCHGAANSEHGRRKWRGSCSMCLTRVLQFRTKWINGD